MNSSSSWMSPLLSETESGARHRYSHQWKRHRKVTEEIMNDNKLPTCYPWGPLGCSRQKSVKLFQECRQSESSGACRWRLRTTTEDPQLFTVSLRRSRGVCEHVCVWKVCVCVCVGGVNRIPRPCYCLGFLKVTVCLEIPLLVLLCEQHHDCRYHHQQWQSALTGISPSPVPLTHHLRTSEPATSSHWL